MRLALALALLVVTSHVSARPHILVVTATAGYRHESIPAAEEILTAMASDHDTDVTFARTPEEVAQLDLEGVAAVFFVNTTGELPKAAADAIVAWVRDGGTFVGVHAASDTWHAVPEYLEMLGGEFAGHPPEMTATVIVDDRGHVATRLLPATHDLFEEYYSLAGVDRSNVRMLLSFGASRDPLAWEKRFGKGRVLYTALGHREDVWRSAWFHTHMSGVMEWAVCPPEHRKRRAVRR